MGRTAEHFDVAIVGARCAGSPLAAMLARRGLRVCLIDRARFPSESLSTHVIQPCGVALLERLGVLEAILAAGAARLTRFTLVSVDAPFMASRWGTGGLWQPRGCGFLGGRNCSISSRSVSGMRQPSSFITSPMGKSLLSLREAHPSYRNFKPC